MLESCLLGIVFFFFKQKTAYEMRISDWSSDVCSSDLVTGKIDRFFWQRFGAAMLFSVLDAGGQIAGQAVSPQGSTVFRTPGDSTSQILQDTQNIRPIVRVNQGTELAITV